MQRENEGRLTVAVLSWDWLWCRPNQLWQREDGGRLTVWGCRAVTDCDVTNYGREKIGQASSGGVEP